MIKSDAKKNSMQYANNGHIIQHYLSQIFKITHTSSVPLNEVEKNNLEM